MCCLSASGELFGRQTCTLHSPSLPGHKEFSCGYNLLRGCRAPHEDTLSHGNTNEGGRKIKQDIPITMSSAALGLLSSHPVATCCALLLGPRNALRNGSQGRHQKRKLPRGGTVSERQQPGSFAIGWEGLWAYKAACHTTKLKLVTHQNTSKGVNHTTDEPEMKSGNAECLGRPVLCRV